MTLTVQDETPSTSVRVEQVAKGVKRNTKQAQLGKTTKLINKKPQAKQKRDGEVGAFFMTTFKSVVGKLANNMVSLYAVARAVAAVMALVSVVASSSAVFRIVLVASEGK